MDALNATPVIPQQGRYFGRAAERGNQLGVVTHTHITHHVDSRVNAPSLHISFRRRENLAVANERDPHPSLTRLRECLRAATNRADLDFADITELLEIDSAVMTNWKRRGVPALVAVEVEHRFGHPASYIVLGEYPKVVPDKPDMSTRPTPSPSDWAVLDAIGAMPPEMKEAKLREILSEGEKWKAYEEAVLRKYRKDP